MISQAENRKNPNHPLKGSSVKVEPIRNRKDIETIKKVISSGSRDKKTGRDLTLFVVGINTNLRASDLIKLKVSQVQEIKPGGDFEIIEQKTGKLRRVTLNKACVEAINDLLSSQHYDQDDYLFQGLRPYTNSQGQTVNHITAIYVNHLVKKWAAEINLKGNYGAHTLRKTWGYHQRVTFKVDIPTLMTCFNHTTQKQTLNYLCVQPSEIKTVFENCL